MHVLQSVHEGFCYMSATTAMENSTISHEVRARIPLILLVGRTNVGKSTLFNRLSSKTKSIVMERDHVTRDYLSERISWGGVEFELVDTGGLEMKNQTNEIFEVVEKEVIELARRSTLIFFVCDVKTAVTEADIRIARFLHKLKRKVVLVVNKIDNRKSYNENIYSFFSLGFGEPISISAMHGDGISKVLDRIVEAYNSGPDNLTAVSKKEPDNPIYTVTIVGTPNVGKSSLVNLMLHKNRQIVSDKPGTTREAVATETVCLSDPICLVDTAGVRRKSRIEDPLEKLMAKSSLFALKSSQIVILVIDASQLKISHQELRLLELAYKNKKSIILVINKIDLLDNEEKIILRNDIKQYEFISKKVPTVYLSCKTGKNLQKLSAELCKAWRRRKIEIDSVEMEETLRNAFERKPIFSSGTRLRVSKVRQQKSSAAPTFVLHVNHPELFGESHISFVENLVRAKYDLKGCPITFIKKRG